MKKNLFLLATGLLVLNTSCGPSPQSAVQPSPSPSTSVTPVATPLPSAVPTPEPTTTPFPVGTPLPSATPLPTPTPIFNTLPSENGTEVTLQFKARVITAAREVLPVVESEFTVNPYPLTEVKASLAIRNNVEAMPVPPRESDAKYQIEEKVCNSSGCSTQIRIDSVTFQQDFNAYRNSILPEWEARAYKGLEDELARLSRGRSSLKFSTNKNGEATLRLQTGKWYFSGRYSYGLGNTVVWEDVMFDVRENTKTLELTR